MTTLLFLLVVEYDMKKRRKRRRRDTNIVGNVYNFLAQVIEWDRMREKERSYRVEFHNAHPKYAFTNLY